MTGTARKALLAIGVVGVAVVGVLLLSGGEDDRYLVRAIFDNGGFVVEGEEVRIAGATVGEIASVDVTQPGELASFENGRYVPEEGKAVAVLAINDPGFQDFRTDAGCLIRPQSLIGEKFVDCRPTLPRAPDSEPPPELKVIPEGEPGAGQRLLPLQNNSTSVDPDLINNINRLPYAQRFRLILNELGASFAGRGEDLQEVVERANPVLRDVNKLFGILSRQRNQLAKLASDSDAILQPLARNRANVAGFITNSATAAEASSERGQALEESLRKFPQFLRELRRTMGELEGFSDAATPVFADLGRAAPALTRATKALTPFSAASTVSIKSLGAAGETAGPKIRQATPVIAKASELAQSGARPTNNLAQLLVSLNKEKGFQGLLDLIYNSAAATNEFDEYGHFGRTLPALTNCLELVTAPTPDGCNANFNGFNAAAPVDPTASVARLARRARELQENETGGTSAADPVGPQTTAPSAGSATPGAGAPSIGQGEPLEDGAADSAEGEPETEASAGASAGPRRALLDYLLGP